MSRWLFNKFWHVWELNLKSDFHILCYKVLLRLAEIFSNQFLSLSYFHKLRTFFVRLVKLAFSFKSFDLKSKW